MPSLRLSPPSSSFTAPGGKGRPPIGNRHRLPSPRPPGPASQTLIPLLSNAPHRAPAPALAHTPPPGPLQLRGPHAPRGDAAAAARCPGRGQEPGLGWAVAPAAADLSPRPSGCRSRGGRPLLRGAGRAPGAGQPRPQRTARERPELPRPGAAAMSSLIPQRCCRRRDGWMYPPAAPPSLSPPRSPSCSCRPLLRFVARRSQVTRRGQTGTCGPLGAVGGAPPRRALKGDTPQPAAPAPSQPPPPR